MSIELIKVPSISYKKEKERLLQEFIIPEKPVIITDICEDWSAYKKWTYNYFKNLAGDLPVRLFSNENRSTNDRIITHSDIKMKFADYLDLIEKEPTDLRIFAFNIFKKFPELKKDFSFPTHITKGFIKSIPLLFFGGEGSVVDFHYDIDMSHVFLTQFDGTKRVILFTPDSTPFLYSKPFTVESCVDVKNPDYETYPGLKYVSGLEAVINHGDTLYMPTKHWHYIEYSTGGFSMALRAMNSSLSKKMKGAWNVFGAMNIDGLMKRFFTKSWDSYKTKSAHKKANKAIHALERKNKTVN